MLYGLSTCGCSEDSCCTLPPEFVRVRYFYGQRLGVMELSDEAAYHQGKHAFHNARLHGAGVLCGLRAGRFTTLQGATTTTVLRVTKGAAIDACGREIIVGVDQCIDIAAWFARNKARQELAGWTESTTQTLHLCLRYHECPSDPSPAPRDPCGCGSGSCEYGRVREGFELSLLTADEASTACKDVSFPPIAAVLDALDASGPVGAEGATGAALGEAIADLLSAGCPEPVEDICLCLASFDVELDATPVPVNITDPDNHIPERRPLLSTSTLQAMTLALAVGSAEAGLLGGGPRIGPMTFTATGADAGTLVLPVALALSGDPPTETPLAEATCNPAIVVVRELDPVTGWQDVAPAPVANFDAGPPPQFTVTFASGLEKDVTYLLIFGDVEAPVVDTAGRSLRPQRLVRQFRFVEEAGELQLDPLV